MPAHLMDDGKHEETNKGRNLFAVSGRGMTAQELLA